jgi:glucose/arabinose dehydrogenase
MITYRKRILAVSTPVIFGAACMASALGAVEIMSGSAADTAAVETAPVVTMKSAKGDLKADLAEIRDRPMRCVAGFQKTTCTGWPVSGEEVAYRIE